MSRSRTTTSRDPRRRCTSTSVGRLRYTLDRLGPHGLPLIGRADWNDCLNLNAFSEEPGESFQTVPNREGGVAESVFIAGSSSSPRRSSRSSPSSAACRRMRAAIRSERERMIEAVREHGWDGDWFRRAYDFFGDPVGSAENDEGQIWIEPQGICVMAGVGLDDGTAARALDVRRRHGLPRRTASCCSTPPSPATTSSSARSARTRPATRRTAGCSATRTRGSSIAETIVGNADRALDHYLRINPSAREELSDVHRCEPYVYAQMIAGKEAPTPGEAKNSWLTGSAAWNFVAITQWILGIRPEHEGLRIDPCLPSDWDGFRAVRRFRGATYRIAIGKPVGITGRITSLLVDGRQIDGNVVAPAPEGADVTIEGTID